MELKSLTISGKTYDDFPNNDQHTHNNKAILDEITEAPVTKQYVDDNKFSGDYNDLTNTPSIPTVPTSLKNPKALKFTGGATGTYDGSSELTINIPNSSGESSGVGLGITGAAVGQIAKITAVDNNGTPISWAPVDMTTGSGNTDLKKSWHDWIDLTVSTNELNALNLATGDDGSTLSEHNCSDLLIYSPSAVSLYTTDSTKTNADAALLLNEKYSYQLTTFLRTTVGLLYLYISFQNDGLRIAYRGRDTDIYTPTNSSMIFGLNNGAFLTNTNKNKDMLALANITDQIELLNEYITSIKIMTSDNIKAGVRFLVKARW